MPRSTATPRPSTGILTATGWMIRLKVADKGELGSLLSAADYKKKIGQ